MCVGTFQYWYHDNNCASRRIANVSDDKLLFEDELPPVWELTEFQSTNLERVFQVSVDHNAEELGHEEGQPITLQIEITGPSLWRMIPEPHWLGQLPHGPQQLHVLEDRKLGPYSRQCPIPLDLEIDMSQFFSGVNSYTRCEWVIPVRGRLHFPDATPARMCDSEDLGQLGVRKVTKADGEANLMETCICWSPKALGAFWNWLAEYHENGMFGPIALSFEPVVPGTYHVDVYKTAEDEIPEIGGDLEYIDHIKVFHDAYVSMYLRNAISLWKYQSTPSSRGRQFLKGAKLLLIGSAKAVCIV
ncbi:hypothetical protein NEOLEDRAFT_1129620 [Neolentinus lepideus HHB14362 ss-1]|uniref:Uncharacterized protein n=1 Tax=Neolentinus lepideus HHB14362 ss-1 TaxID=1314782 RepID=A0A165UJK3_9AGAM|nr:hypothetical protein NEOLEDRAFT_1129620 [Neolentinus lepideus HHB14362 ss-1]